MKANTFITEVSQVLDRSLGSRHAVVSAFHRIRFSAPANDHEELLVAMNDRAVFQTMFTRALSQIDDVLAEAISRIEALPEVPVPPMAQAARTTLDVIERLLWRFPAVARQLRTRHSKRDTLVIEDEYDVQDLLRALLRIDFDDVRAEEYGPMVAGRRPRMDFLLKQEQIVIEVKMTRDTLKDKELGDELLQDIARYQGHSNCKRLYCFIYDPQCYVDNPAGLTADLERLAPLDLPVHVRIHPVH